MTLPESFALAETLVEAALTACQATYVKTTRQTIKKYTYTDYVLTNTNIVVLLYHIPEVRDNPRLSRRGLDLAVAHEATYLAKGTQTLCMGFLEVLQAGFDYIRLKLEMEIKDAK